ncbi:MAG: glycosyltransferase [Rikenellaceae bacterium]
MSLFIKKESWKGEIHTIRYYLWKLRVFKKEYTYAHRRSFLFGIKIGERALEAKAIDNVLSLSEIFSSPSPRMISKEVDIVIPVYNGYEYLEPLFKTLIANTDLPYNLYVINDCSSDERVTPLLKSALNSIDSQRVTIINNDANLGFVKSVNKALSMTKNDVVLVNTDVVLPPNWASKLFRPIFTSKNIASVTPFSNSATIFSLPVIGDNDFDGDLEYVNEQLSKLHAPSQPISLWTGVGFCMAMSRKALDSVGLFDEIFGRGYGEENDWCIRAINNGFVNTLAPDLFVWHKHGGSFSDEKVKLIENNLKILRDKHANHAELTASTSKNLDFWNIRFLGELIFLNSTTNQTEVWFDHTWGGGTELYTLNEYKRLTESTLCIRVQGDAYGGFKISYCYKSYSNEIFVNTFDDVKLLIEQLNVELIVVNNLAGYKDDIGVLEGVAEIKRTKGMKISFRAHDLQCICPNITMVNSKNEYCNCQNLDECSGCISDISTRSKVETIHNGWQAFFRDTVDEVVCFSHSTEDIMLRLYPEVMGKTVIRPHVVPTFKSDGKLKTATKEKSTINIAVLGVISTQKGSLILQQMDEILDNYPKITLTIIGHANLQYERIKTLGKYDRDDLESIIEQNNIDIILIPSIWPETFSYTTSEAMMLGLPVACFNLGAQAEKVSTYDKGLVISKIDAKTALDEIEAFMS